jgi:DNA replication protein DnaC
MATQVKQIRPELCGYLSVDDIVAYGLPYVNLPQAKPCEFCGKTLGPMGIVLNGRVIQWRDAECDCTGAQEKAAEDEARKHQAELDERVRRILGDSGIKNRFLSRTFDNFMRDTPQREKAYSEARFYAEHFYDRFLKDGTGLYLEGTFGTGKTHLAVAIALCLIRQGVNVICKTSIDLLMEIKAAFCYEDGEEEKTARFKRCALFIIDDLGKEQCTDWSLSKLYEIINDRYEKCKPTIVTTNYSQDELIRRLVPKGGDTITAGALVSRLKETAIVMNMVWRDYREGVR